jgi:hypothetical protein
MHLFSYIKHEAQQQGYNERLLTQTWTVLCIILQ